MRYSLAAFLLIGCVGALTVGCARTDPPPSASPASDPPTSPAASPVPSTVSTDPTTPRKMMLGHWEDMGTKSVADNPEYRSTSDDKGCAHLYVSDSEASRIEPGEEPIRVKYEVLEENVTESWLQMRVTMGNGTQVTSRVSFSPDGREMYVTTRQDPAQGLPPDMASAVRTQVGDTTSITTYRRIGEKTSPNDRNRAAQRGGADSIDAKVVAEDLDRMQGKWRLVAMEHSGKPAPEDELKKMSVVFNGNTFTVFDQGRKEELNFKIDPSTNLKLIDFSQGEGEPALGIYSVEADTLKMCWFKGDGKRPSEFKTNENDGYMLVVLKKGKSRQPP